MDALVCCLSGIGNSISTIPMIFALHEMGYEVDVRLHPDRKAMPIFEALPEVREVLEYPEPTLPGQRDIACCTVLCEGYWKGCRLGRTMLMIEPGKVKDFRASSITRYVKHEIEHCMDLARQAGFKGKTPNLRFAYPLETTEPFVSKEDKAIAIGIGYCKGDDTSWKKHWGNKNFAALCRLLVDDGFCPVIIGDEEDIPNATEIVKLTERPDEVHMFTGQPLMEALRVFSQCVGCVTNETMLTVASAIGVPCISMIFDEAFNNPLKTYPYPAGVAVTGTYVNMKPEKIFTMIKQKMSGERHFSKITAVNERPISIKDSDLHAVKRGFGETGPLVSIVVLVYDEGEGDAFTMASVAIKNIRQTAPKDSEIIIVANSPSDKLRKTIANVEAEDSRVVSVTLNQNLGVVAKNFAYNLAQGKYVLSIDGDVHVEKGWVEKLVSQMEAHPEYGLVGPCGGRLRMDKWAPDAWCCGNFPDGPRSLFGYEDIEFFGVETETGITGTELDVIPSMCWCIRRELFDKIGYLDWRFGPFVGSDADFSFRVKQAGYKVVLARAPIKHVRGGGTSHRLFIDLQELKVDHVGELYKRWHPHAKKLCMLHDECAEFVKSQG